MNGCSIASAGAPRRGPGVAGVLGSLLIVLVLAAGCGAASSPPAFSTWQTVDRDGFTIKMPKTPRVQTQTATPSGLIVAVTTYLVDQGANHYEVVVSTYPDTVDVSQPDRNLQGAINGGLGSASIHNPHVLRNNQVTVSGSPGRLAEANADNGHLLLEVVLKGHTLYQAIAARDDGALAANAQQFVDSLTIR